MLNEDFDKVIHDFTNDLKTTFPELEEKIKRIDSSALYDYCVKIYLPIFFDILYQN